MTQKKGNRIRSILRLSLALALMMVLITATQQETSQAVGAIEPNAVECPSQLRSYWKLDETAGPIYDDFISTNDATCEGLVCPLPSVEDPLDPSINGAQAFSRTRGTRVNVPANALYDWTPSSNVSIEFWMRTPASSTCQGNQVMIGRDAPTAESDLHWWTGCVDDGDKAIFVLTDTDGVGHFAEDGREEPVDITDGNWHHIVAIRLGGAGTLRLYVDGVQAGGTPANDYTGSFASTAPLNIGWLNYSPSLRFNFDGDVDELAIYSRVLTADEVLQHYQSHRSYCVSAAIDLVKTPSATVVRNGDTVVYTYNVTNPGNEVLSNVSLIDDTCTAISGPSGDTNLNNQLDLTETWTYTCSQVLRVTTTNTATVTAVGSSGAQVSDTAQATVEVFDPAITFDKTATPSVAYVNQQVNYTYVVRNVGTAVLSNPDLSDDKCSPITGPQGDTNGNNRLDPQETWTYTCSQRLTQDTTNTARFTCTDPAGNTVSASDTATVDVISPDLAISKTATPTIVVKSDPDPVTYRYQLTNPGDDPLAIVSLTDDKCAPVTRISGDTNANNKLDPGETWVYTCTQTLTEDTTNTATAVATDSAGNQHQRSDTASVDVIAPDITLDKSATLTEIGAGQTATYTYVVTTGSGDVPLAQVSVTDDKCAPVTRTGGDTDGDNELDQGETWTYTCTTALTATTTNTATASGTHPGGGTVSAEDTATVEVAAIGLDKSASSTNIKVGEQVTYTYLVSNTGGVQLSDVGLTDDKCSPVNYVSGDTIPNGKLDTGETWTYRCTQTLNEETTNTAVVTARGTLPTTTVRAQDSVTVRIGNFMVFLPSIFNNY